MAKETPILTTFDGGELAPLIGGRTDLAKYFNGCSVLENFLPTVQGPLVRRGGTQYVASTKVAGQRAWLVRFQVSERIAYMLEFGDRYIRFYTNRGQLVVGGLPVEVETPYNAADLTGEDGTFAVRVAQSADTMYLLHRKHAPRKLLRRTADSFELVAAEFSSGPFDDINTDESVTVNVAFDTGENIMIGASSAIFADSSAGDLVYIETSDISTVRPWAVYQEVKVGDRRRIDNRVYQCTAIGPDDDEGPQVTGNVTPIHTEGRAWDGDGQPVANDSRGAIGVEWEFLHAGYGIVKLRSPVDDTGLAWWCDVVSRLPEEVTGSGSTWKWALPLFSNKNGWPEHGAFWRQRLVLVSGRRVAMSVVGDFENFASTFAGEIETDSAIIQTLNARQINRAVWIVESDELIIGTDGDEWLIGPIQESQAVGPANIRAERRTTYGSRSIQPVEVGGRVLFIQASGQRLRDYVYDYNTNNYASNDTTKLASHILRSGAIDMAYQQEPDSIIWLARADGVLVGCTYDQEPGRSDVYAWHPHPMVNGWVESVETMPAPNGSDDDLWLIVRREINGQAVRYVEVLRAPLADEEDPAEAFYVDCGLTYRGESAATISGLGHLEGQTVQILADGAAHPDRAVSGGQVELQIEASVVHVGLPAPCAMATMSIEAGSANGTAQGKTKRLTNVIARMHRSLGGNLGPSRAALETLNFRRPSQRMNNPPPLYSGDSEPIPWRGGYERSARIWYTNDQPLPVTLLALMPVVSTSDDR
ncbi:hypothetical protein NJI34_37800 [Pseudomonas sp. S 311-6]|nr:hypothetical protein CBF45_12765 [Bordetella sp. J329]MCO7642529.1 hypothetical protein [Pseudomonas sp. S 311-6]